MASIDVIQATVSSTVTNNTTSFVEVVESSALTKLTTYYVICHALTSGSLTHLTDEWRLVDRTNGDAVLSQSTLIREPAVANKTQGYYYVGRFTTSTGTGGLAFEQKSSATNWDCKTQYLSMTIFDLSNLDSRDFFYTENTSDTELTDSLQTFASVSAAVKHNQQWLVYGWQATDTDVVNASSTVMELYCDNPTGTEDEPLAQFEGEDLTEVLGFWMCRGYTINGTGSTNWAVKSKVTNAGVGDNRHLQSCVFGLKLSAFENSYYSYTSAETTTGNTIWNELSANLFGTTSTTDVIVSATAMFTGGATYRLSNMRIQKAGVTVPNTQPDSNYACVANDGTDVLPMGYITKYGSSPASVPSIDLEVKKDSTADIGWKQYTLAMFSTEIKPAINYSSVAGQTYNSGDVAGQTNNSGDVAGQTHNSGDVAAEVTPT